MRIRLLSDLHREVGDPDHLGIRDDVACDVVALAGDIAAGGSGVAWVAETFRTPVVYVPGNHEFYGFEAAEAMAAMRAAAEGSCVHVLDCDAIRINGVRFVGAIGWSGFQTADGSPADCNWFNQFAPLGDLRCIYVGGRLLTAERISAWHTETRHWLAANLSPAVEPSVVVTHFPPSWACRSTRPHADPWLDPYFQSHLDDLMGNRAPLWLYGHNHDAADFIHESGTRLVSNPGGYPGEPTGFVSDKLVDFESADAQTA